MTLRLTVTALDTAKRLEARALLDSGCTTSSIDPDFVKRKQLTTQPAAINRAVYNADGSVNGFIKEYVKLLVVIRDAAGAVHSEKRDFPGANLGGKQDMFLGHDWLCEM